MDIAGDRTHWLFFNPKAIFYLVARFYVKAIFGREGGLCVLCIYVTGFMVLIPSTFYYFKRVLEIIDYIMNSMDSIFFSLTIPKLT